MSLDCPVAGATVKSPLEADGAKRIVTARAVAMVRCKHIVERQEAQLQQRRTKDGPKQSPTAKAI
jgi:hypothetical protein